MQLRGLERWISLIRLIVLPFVLLIVIADDYPAGWEVWAWVTTGGFAVGAAGFFVLARARFAARHPVAQSLAAQIFDTAVITGYVMVFSFERGTPVQQILYIDLAAACVRFQVTGGVALAVISAPILAGFAKLRSDHLHIPFSWKLVELQTGLEFLMAMIVGWLVRRLVAEGVQAEARADEAELLRDELGRRADLDDAVNRCARALNSSLEVPQAFGAFIRELRGLLPFDRVAIVLAEDGLAKVMASAGAGADEVFPAGSEQPLAGTMLEAVIAANGLIYRSELDAAVYPEEREFEQLGLGSRLAAPLLAGARTIGMLSVLRRERDGFTQAERDLVGLLGRLVATAAQNIRAYEAEHRTVEELRRLSTLRADFVSLVSHEVRTPMAAVIGSARPLQQRWRELSPEQRDAFLALIADETDRLAALVGEVLDSSRIDAGTFSYAFADLDLVALVNETVATFELGHDWVHFTSNVPATLPVVSGDPVRLRQVLTNLIDNAVKYSPESSPVEVRAAAVDGHVRIDIVDHGNGIAFEDQMLIFEKFGRVRGTSFKPGSGLGLYIARAIAEAHHGSLKVNSTPGQGATFTLMVPLSADAAAELEPLESAPRGKATSRSDGG
jgi:signal transduction histidine kinase